MHPFPEELFPSSWLSSKAPVFFDFGARGANGNDNSPAERFLWRLLPRVERQAIVLRLPREVFLRTALEDSKQLLFSAVPALVDQWRANTRTQQGRELLRMRSAHKPPRFHRRRF